MQRPYYLDRQYKAAEELLQEVVLKGIRPSFESVSCPEQIKKFIEECWDADPQQRPTFRTIRKRLEKILSTL